MVERISEFYVEVPNGRADRVVIGPDNTIVFDNEIYVPTHRSSDTISNITECVRAHETVHTWTKLITISRAPSVQFDFKQISSGLRRAMKQESRDVFYRIFETPINPIIVFQAHDPSAGQFEFNVHAYAQHERRAGLIAFLFAQRFPDTSDQAQTDRERQKAVQLVSEIRLVGFDRITHA